MKPRIDIPRVFRFYSTSQTPAASSFPPSTGPAPSKVRFIPTSGTYPRGFLVSGIHVGVKKNPRLLDLAVITSTRPIHAAAVFTTNQFLAAPVLVCKRILEQGGGSEITGLVVNSGCANAVTGEGGMKDAESMARTLGNQGEALVMSTGVIGQRLPIEKILRGVPVAVSRVGDSHQHWLDAATAFCTTDTFPKLLSREIQTDGGSYRIAGITKGAGMIHPNMATLLSSIFTDAPISPRLLKKVLSHAVERSFNAISVDGDMSTNDTLAILANGASSIPEITGGKELDEFQNAVTQFAEELAKLVVWDGEGATKFVTIKVKDAMRFEDAKQIASTIARSALVKTALFGMDANWGRILCATGYAGVPVNPNTASVSFIPRGEMDGQPRLKLLVNGEPENVDEDLASKILAEEQLEIEVDLGLGGGHEARYYTCDFSYDYVSINGSYRT